MPRRSSLLVAVFVALALLVAGPTRGSSHVSSSPRNAAALPISPIQHVIFIYRENHSFDNVFGPYCVQHPTHHCDGRTGTVTYSDGIRHSTLPAADIVPGVCHAAICQTRAINGGRMDGWNRIVECTWQHHFACLQQFQPKQIRILTTLADNGVLADRFFSALSTSAGAHMFFITGEDRQGFTGETPIVTPPGYVAHIGWGCDSNKQGDWINPATGQQSEEWFCNPNAPWLPNGGAAGPTRVGGVPDFFTSILDAHGIGWKNYGESGPHSLYQWNLPPYAAAALDHDRKRMVREQLVVADALSGTLPQVAFVTPSHDAGRQSTSQHNTQSMKAGDNFITEVMAGVLGGPDAATTAVIVSWDDCGCFYDHVPPPPGLGIRVPLLIWSAWSKSGYVDHQPAQFSSVLAFIEHNFNLSSLTSLNPKAYDGRVSNDLMGDFNFAQPFGDVQRHLRSLQLPGMEPLSPAAQRWLAVHGHDEDSDDT